MILAFTEVYMVNGHPEVSDFKKKILKGDKIHTIRMDVHNRWQPGKKIHCAQGVRTDKYDCFFEGICTSTQTLEINDNRDLIVDGNTLSPAMARLLQQNDGFKSEAHFWAWFGSYIPFKGKIIHWTNFKY